MEQIKFTADRSGERIDRFLSENLENLSRSYIQKLLKDGKISVNQSSVKPNYTLSENDKIEVFIPDPEVLDILPENIPLDILY
ncbi:S4 domain-containing protein, partial [[Ruminococcus] torques]|uniref:S4 domain-containing protein n=1 Tax=[Ruminococcus] torques TaxID=33039 RepID=UPI0023B1E1E0